MKKLIFLVFLFSFNLLVGQNKGVVVSKVTATWCPNCGSWGWDYFEALRDIYNNQSDVCLLGVHHSGDLQNPVSNWFANNLNNAYQPEFYVNNQQVDALSFNWNSKVQELQDMVSQYRQETAFVSFDFINAFIESGEIVCNLNFGPSSKVTGDYYFAVYVFENGVENFQSSRGMTMHPNVLRSVIGSSNYGDLYVQSGQSAPASQQEFRLDIDSNWNADNLGLVAIMWREDGSRYIVDNAKSIYNIALLSSTNEIDEDLISVKYVPNGLLIEAPEYSSNMVYHIHDSEGKRLKSGTLNKSQLINNSQYSSGIYTLIVQKADKVFSKQVVIVSQ